MFYVTNQSHRFLSNRTERYEGGTPDGIGIQRVGLALLAGRRVASEYERIAKLWSSSSSAAAAAAAAAAHGSGGSGEANEGNDGPLESEGVGRTILLSRPTPPPRTLLEYECSTYDRAVAELRKNAPNLIILGRRDADEDGDGISRPNGNGIDDGGAPLSPSCAGRHLPILSFLIRCGRRFLHYNYVCAVLNDVFGIQSRGGCQCAGPYSQRLLGLTSMIKSAPGTGISEVVEVPSDANEQIERALLRSDRPCELLRPGYTRLSLPFKGLREEEADYALRALIWVARNGWALLPQYRCDHRTGEWRHWSRRGKPLGKSERLWLSHYDILAPSHPPSSAGGVMNNEGDDPSFAIGENIIASRSRLDRAMNNADAILEATKRDPRFLSEVEKMNPATGMLGSGRHNDSGDGGVDNTLEDLRWYVYPQEMSQYLRDGLEEVPDTFDDDALLGAIYVRMDGRRKNNIVVEGGSVATTESSSGVDGNASTAREMMCASKEPDLIPFQDGDHVGEAPYDEIKAGYEDGELGETCEVYEKARDEWVVISKFIQEYESGGNISSAAAMLDNDETAICRKRNLSAMTSSSPSCGEGTNPKTFDSSPSVVIHSPPLSTMQSIITLPPAVEKREKKKPSRDSSQWGRSLPHSAPSSCVLDSSATLAPTNSNEVAKNNSEVEDSPVAKAMSNRCIKNKGKIKPPPKLMRYVTQVSRLSLFVR